MILCKAQAVPVAAKLLFGTSYRKMVQNQLRPARAEMLTCSFLCEA